MLSTLGPDGVYQSGDDLPIVASAAVPAAPAAHGPAPSSVVLVDTLVPASRRT